MGFLEQPSHEEDAGLIINLISIYDKSDVESISDAEIRNLIKNRER